jgi:hypothetical protein
LERTQFDPAYLNLLRSGEPRERVKEVYKRLEACDVCPRECGVNRRESAKGAICRTKRPFGLAATEAEIDRLAAELWGMTEGSCGRYERVWRS